MEQVKENLALDNGKMLHPRQFLSHFLPHNIFKNSNPFQLLPSLVYCLVEIVKILHARRIKINKSGFEKRGSAIQSR